MKMHGNKIRHCSDTITPNYAFEEEICFTNTYLWKHKII